MRKFGIFFLSGLVLCMAGCTQRVDLDAAKESLLETDREFARAAIQEGVAAAFNRFMADEATVFRPNDLPFVGREAILELMSQSPAGSLSWEPYFVEVSASADLGYTLGQYTFTAEGAEEGDQPIRGHYLTIWKKQADGNWKLVFDTGAQSPPGSE